MTTFCSFASSNFKVYLLIWKCHRDSKTSLKKFDLLVKRHNFQDFLNDHYSAQKISKSDLEKKVPDKLSVNDQKLVHNI